MHKIINENSLDSSGIVANLWDLRKLIPKEQFSFFSPWY